MESKETHIFDVIEGKTSWRNTHYKCRVCNKESLVHGADHWKGPMADCDGKIFKEYPVNRVNYPEELWNKVWNIT